MSPDLLAQYLKVARSMGAASIGLEIPLMFDSDVVVSKVSVVFEPRGFEEPNQVAPGAPVTPGGWKGETHNLDQSLVEDDKVP